MLTPAYFIFDVTVHDPDKLKLYLHQADKTIKAYGGKMIIAGGIIAPFEGNTPTGKLIMIQFASSEQAHAWYDSPEYQAIIGYRFAATTSHVYLIEGIASAN